MQGHTEVFNLLKVKERGLLGRREERGGQRDGDRSRAMEASSEKPSTGAEWADALQVKLYISETNICFCIAFMELWWHGCFT